ncbi:MAG: nucleotidyl transferase AbiEii/AbiGii toxin family protein [Myxococcales bacterium]|nr:nucleotidyl transferase AbiEii/AbiGii toxin family protein [Myxococcales bacterium]
MSATPHDDAISVALRVAAAVEAAGGTYFVGGSLASSLDGEPRSTNDIDFVIDLPVGRVAALAAALGPDFEVDEAMLRDALLRGTCANAFYLPWVLKVDFFGNAHGDFDESEFSRRRRVEVRSGASLYVKSPEDTVLRKLAWYQAGGEVSERQWRDVQGVLRTHADDLDQSYLEAWSRRLGVEDLLAKARREALG